MTRALIDTNVILDVLFEREEFLAPAKAIWLAIENKQVEGYISVITPVTVFYIARRQTKNKKRSLQIISELLGVFHACPLTENMLHTAMSLPFSDFEDSIQAVSALMEGLEVIVTRDEKDYAQSPIPAISPQDFLAKLGA